MYKEFTGMTKEFARKWDRFSINWENRQVICANTVDGTVLDVGCGSGMDAGKYDPKLYFGIDVSPPLIEVAKEYNPNHKFKVCDATKIPFKSNSFDNAFCIGVLEGQPSIKRARKILSEMVRVAKKRVLISWYKPPHEGKTVITRLTNRYGMLVFSNRYNKNEFVGNLRAEVLPCCGGAHAVWVIDNDI